MSRAGPDPLAGPWVVQPTLSQPLASPSIERLRQEAREQEQRQAEEKARQAREMQAWVQLKEREVQQLQVGPISGECGWRPRAQPGWLLRPRVLSAGRGALASSQAQRPRG